MSFDDVWFTCKARIAAELRLKNNDLHSQILLVWYAILSAAAAIVAIRYPQFSGPNTDIYSAILSVALLAISLLVTGRDYRGRALQMRENHIALKNLYDGLKAQSIPALEKPKRFADLLANCENHSSYDDRYFRIFNKKGLIDRIPTRIDYLLAISMMAFRLFYAFVLYTIPIAIVIAAMSK